MNGKANWSAPHHKPRSRVTARRKMASIRIGNYRRRCRATPAAVARHPSSAALLAVVHEGGKTQGYISATGGVH